MITKRAPARTGPSFLVSVDAVVPTEIQLNSLPSEAEELAPQLRGFSYVVVERRADAGYPADAVSAGSPGDGIERPGQPVPCSQSILVACSVGAPPVPFPRLL